MGTDSTSSDALLLLLETVNKQANQLKRLEAIVSGSSYTCDTNTYNHSQYDTNTGTHKHLQQLQSSVEVLQQHHAAACMSSKGLAEQLHKVEQRVQQLEAQGRILQQQNQQLQQQLGSPAPARNAVQRTQASLHFVGVMSGSPGGASTAKDAVLAPTQGPAAFAAPVGKSMAARLVKLEQQVDNLSASASVVEDKLQVASAAVQELEADVSQQVQNIQADVKQAITVATSSLREDINSKQQQSAAQLKGLASELDELVANSQHTLIAKLTAELERQTAAVQEGADGRIAAIEDQLGRLEEEKADITLVTQYTGQVADVFEQLATTVADSTQASIAQLMTQQQELRTLITNLTASKAESSNLLQHQQNCQQQLLELQRGLAAAQAAASEAAVAAAVAKTALEPMDGLRLQLAETQGVVAALQTTTTGLETASTSCNNQQQQQDQQLQHLASSLHMLQQQLLALSNHVDPAAAAQLAAAAAGDDSALTFQPLGSLAGSCATVLSNTLFDAAAGPGVWCEGWLTSSYLQSCSHNVAKNLAVQAANQDSGSGAGAPNTPTLGGCAAPAARPGASGSSGGAQGLQDTPAAGKDALAGAPAGGANTTANKDPADRMGAVLRHLPVAVRLLRLETAVRDLGCTVAQKADAGDVAVLQQQLECVSDRVRSGFSQLDGVNCSSLSRLEQHITSLSESVQAVGERLSVCPTHTHMQEAVAASCKATTDTLQQQLTVGLSSVQAQVHVTAQDLQKLSNTQADALHQVEQQVMQQVTGDIKRHQEDMQQLLASHKEDVVCDTIKQLKADQEVVKAEEAMTRVSTLESHLKVVVTEVDRMQEQANLTARLQDKHTDMVTALEAALSAQSNKNATVSQQLRLELADGLDKACQAQSSHAATVEASLQEQSEAVTALAAAVADLPQKGRVLEVAIKVARSAVEELLSQHKKQEERRWEAWLSEFARALEQRPTAAQLNRQVQSARQAAVSDAHEAAAQRIECVMTSMEARLRQQLRHLQLCLQQLRCRTETLEQGTGVGGPFCDAFGTDVLDLVSLQPSSQPVAQHNASSDAAAAPPEGQQAQPVATGAQHQAPVAVTVPPASSPQVNVAAIVAAFEAAPAPGPGPAGTSMETAVIATEAAAAGKGDGLRADAPSVCGAIVAQRSPVTSLIPASIMGAAASAAEDTFSVAARVEGKRSASGLTVQASSIYDSCEADSTPFTGQLSSAGGIPAAAETEAVDAKGKGHSSAAGGHTSINAQDGSLNPQQQQSVPMDASAAGHQAAAYAVTCPAALGGDVAPPVRSSSPEIPEHCADNRSTPASRLCGGSSSHLSSGALPTASAAEQGGQSQALHRADDPVRGTTDRRTQVKAGDAAVPKASARPLAPSHKDIKPFDGNQVEQSQFEGGATDGAETKRSSPQEGEAADCADELEQLLDLQQQVQQCLLNASAAGVRRAKPPKQRHHLKGHKRTRIHSKEGHASTPAAEGTETDQQAGVLDAAEAKRSGVAAAAAVNSVAAAIAAATAAMAERQLEAGGAEGKQHSQGHQVAPAPAQQQPTQEPTAATAQDVPVMPPQRAKDILGLLTLQQQLSQCLKEHGCVLDQLQQQSPGGQAAMADADVSSNAARSNQQKDADGKRLSPGNQQELRVQQQQRKVQEVQLEQLLVLQAQLHQAARHQNRQQ